MKTVNPIKLLIRVMMNENEIEVYLFAKSCARAEIGAPAPAITQHEKYK